MADSDKDILITPNVSQTSQPEIKLVGKDNSPMYLKVLDDNTLSFEGTEGQVFSIGPTMSSGDIFSVSDISGVQSMVVNADGTITIDAQTKSTTIKNSASNTATLILENTNADAIDGPILDLYRNDGANSGDGDDIGAIVWSANNDAGEKTNFGRIMMEPNDVSNGSEDGEMIFKLTEAGSVEQEFMRLRGGSRQIELNTSKDDIDLVWNSDTVDNVLFCNAGTSRIGIGTTSPGELLHLSSGAAGDSVSLKVTNTDDTDDASVASLHLESQRGTDSEFFIEHDAFGATKFYNGQGAKTHALTIDASGSIDIVGKLQSTNADGWNLFQKLTFGKLDYGTANSSGSGLTSVTIDDNEAGIASVGIPRDITIRAVHFRTNGVVLSGTTAQVWRIFANGDAGSGTLTDISLNAGNFTRQNSENVNATGHNYVVTGLSASYDAGDVMSVRRESGAVDMGDVFVDIYYSVDNA